MSRAETNSAQPSLEIHLLGPFRLLVDTNVVEEQQWARRKPAALIKLLALQPHHQLHREQLMELLWPERDAETAANNLNKCIHAARRALEPDLKSGSKSQFIVTSGHQVRLRSPGELWIDKEAFEQAAAEALKTSDCSTYEKALELYGGDLLIEDPYADWTSMPRENLRTLRRELLAKVAKLYESRGEFSSCIERLREVLAIDRSNEEAHR